MARENIGFIGLGAMGKPMAGRLLAEGFPVTSRAHRRREAIDELKRRGLVEAGTPREVASGADIVITMVRDTATSEEVILGPDGVLDGMARGATLIVMSTVDPEFCRRVAKQAAASGVDVLDAPVSGFPFRAEQGTLALMVGGAEGVIERRRPCLEAMGTVFPCGAAGMGMVAKLANNAVAVGTMALLQEARAFAAAHGMPGERLMEVFRNASADSFMVRNWAAIAPMWEHVVALGLKDLRTGLEAAQSAGTAMPLTAAALARDWGSEN